VLFRDKEIIGDACPSHNTISDTQQLDYDVIVNKIDHDCPETNNHVLCLCGNCALTTIHAITAPEAPSSKRWLNVCTPIRHLRSQAKRTDDQGLAALESFKELRADGFRYVIHILDPCQKCDPPEISSGWTCGKWATAGRPAGGGPAIGQRRTAGEGPPNQSLLPHLSIVTFIVDDEFCVQSLHLAMGPICVALYRLSLLVLHISVYWFINKTTHMATKYRASHLVQGGVAREDLSF
jgi:hypothetical protein